MRDLKVVIDRMLPIITAKGVDARGLVLIRDAVGFTAPEAIIDRWRQTQEWLVDNVPSASWADAVRMIWNGEADK